MWEVFDPRNGIPIGIRYPWEWMARLACKLSGRWDYARQGDGW